MVIFFKKYQIYVYYEFKIVNFCICLVLLQIFSLLNVLGWYFIAASTRSAVDKGDSEGRTPSLLNLHQDSDCEGGAEASIRVSSLHIVLLSIFD